MRIERAPSSRCGVARALFLSLALLVTGPTSGSAADFVRGDCNPDGSVDISDVIRQLIVITGSPTASPCLDACDVNDDGLLNIVDPVYLLYTLFVTGSLPPAPPFPSCGSDPTTDAIDCTNSACP